MARRLPSTPPILPGFSYLHILGSGGFADVFLYEQNMPRRQVAVKVMLSEVVNDQVRQMFQAEANLVNARSFERYVKYRLLAASGMLLATLGIEPPEDATPYAGQRVGAPPVGASNTEQHFDAGTFRDWRKTVGN